MNLQEFKAWFQGYTENINGQPSKKQWDRICKRVEEITDYPTTYPVFIRQYPYYQPTWYTTGYSHTTTGATLTTSNADNAIYCATQDFTELGRIDAQN